MPDIQQMNAEEAKKLSIENEKRLLLEKEAEKKLRQQKYDKEEKKREDYAREHANHGYQNLILPAIKKAVAEGKGSVYHHAGGDLESLYREHLKKLLKEDGYEVEESYTTHDIDVYRRYTFKILWREQ